MLLKKKLLVFFILLALPLVGAMSFSLFDSDFDKFAKKLYRQLGYSNSSEPNLRARDAVLAYLKENNIDDPIAFFEENMDIFSDRKRLEDSSYHEETQEKLRAEGIVWTQSFTKTFKLITMIIAHGELRIHIFEKADGEIVLRASIFLHTL